MSGYLILAENVIFKNNKLTCINIYDGLSAIAMPAEFKFDLAIMCGPNWSKGEHKLTLKVRANEGEEKVLSESQVNIPHEDFVYSAVANDVKFAMNYDVKYLTFIVYDNDKEVITRKYPVTAVLYPQKIQSKEEEIVAEKSEPVKEEKTENKVNNSKTNKKHKKK